MGSPLSIVYFPFVDPALEAYSNFLLLFICLLAYSCFFKKNNSGIFLKCISLWLFSLKFRIGLGKHLYSASCKKFSSISSFIFLFYVLFSPCVILTITYQLSWIYFPCLWYFLHDLYLFMYFALYLIFLYKISDFSHLFLI